MAGGAELIVAWLSEGLVERGHRVTVVSTCGPDMQPYPAEKRNGVTVIRFFPRNVYWNFAREGQSPVRRALWHLRDAWNRDAARRFRAILADGPPDIVHTHLIDGFSASIWRRARQRGVPVVHTAHDYHLLCPRAFLLTRELANLPATDAGLPRRTAPGICTRRRMSICSSAPRNSCSTSTARRAWRCGRPLWFATASRPHRRLPHRCLPHRCLPHRCLPHRRLPHRRLHRATRHPARPAASCCCAA